MFFNFDYSNLKTKSIIYVDLIGNLTDNDEFKSFTDQWLDLYNLKTKFTFIFNTDKVEYVHPKFCLTMSMFIYKLKKRETQYLNMSILFICCSLRYKCVNKTYRDIVETYTNKGKYTAKLIYSDNTFTKEEFCKYNPDLVIFLI